MKQLLIPIAALMFLGTSCTKAVIDQAAADMTDPVVLPDTAVFNPDVRDIMQNSCLTCHGGLAPAAGIDLNTYNVVRQSAEFGNLVQRMNSTTSPMPPSGTLPPSQLSVIDKWVQSGFPEN